MRSKRIQVNVKTSMEEYINRSDWRVHANANQKYSLGGLILNVAGKVTANYWLSHIYTKDIGDAHRNADIHIHDLDLFSGYCAGWSLRQLLQEGLNGVAGNVESGPPKHMSSAVGQIINFLGTLQNEWAGAQAFSSFDTYMAPFIKKDNLKYELVYQYIQELIYNLNVTSRFGNQTIFSNLTFDWTCPEDIQKDKPLIGGEEMWFTYGDLQKEMDMINRAFIEVMTKGDSKGRVFTFPIPTYNITKDFNWDSENSKLLFEMTAKYGLPYFQNFINSELKPTDIRSMCPLTPDTEILVKNGFNEIVSRPITDVIQTIEKKNGNYEVYTSEGWKKFKPVKIPKTDIFKITLNNGTQVRMGENHLQPTKNKGNVLAKYLEVNDWLPFNKTIITTTDLGDFNLGYIVGAYYGDGCRDDRQITYTICGFSKSDSVEEKITKFWKNLGFKVTVTLSKRNVRFIRIGAGSSEFIKQFVEGDCATNKVFTNKCLTMSIEFRNGLIEGLKMTDGSRDKKRIYTASIEGAQSILKIFSSLGLKALISSEDERSGRLGENPVYCLSYPERKSYGNYFDEDDNFHYYRITEIEKLPYSGDFLYCLEVENENHLFMLSNGLITHNCRLQLDLRELLKRGNGLFGSAEQTGSLGVVTINCARLGFNYKKNKKGLYKQLDYLLELSKKSLEIKRKVIQEHMDRGLFPYTKRYLGTLRNHFSTIGVNGINEMIRNFTNDKHDITSPEGHKLAVEFLDRIRSKVMSFQETTGHMYNLEATPAEGTTYRFAKEDKKRFPNIIQAGQGNEIYYTNSSQLPAGFTDDPFEALEKQEELQRKYTGGTVLHLYLGERISNGDACKKLVRRALEQYSLPYITVTPTFSICPKHGYLKGEHKFCPLCDEELMRKKVTKT